MITCDACGLFSKNTKIVQVHTTNGHLQLCLQCLADFNCKNPVLAGIIRAAVDAKLEEAAKALLETKGGYSASIDENVLVPDPDGPWLLNADAAKVVLALASCTTAE